MRPSEPLLIRTATTDDLPAILAFDHRAATDPARRQLVTDAVHAGTCFVAADADGRPIAYAIYQHRFFGHVLIELLYTNPTHRRRGIATALITHCERHACQTPKLFISTNRSNTPMRTLLANLGFTHTGTIDDLDEGDPELIYVKRLPHLAPGEHTRGTRERPTRNPRL
jgi:ribosomal protein S18 acetylase RimI-like enzyme